MTFPAPHTCISMKCLAAWGDNAGRRRLSKWFLGKANWIHRRIHIISMDWCFCDFFGILRSWECIFSHCRWLQIKFTPHSWSKMIVTFCLLLSLLNFTFSLSAYNKFPEIKLDNPCLKVGLNDITACLVITPLYCPLIGLLHVSHVTFSSNTNGGQGLEMGTVYFYKWPMHITVCWAEMTTHPSCLCTLH